MGKMKGAGGLIITLNSSAATRQAPTFSGSRTNPWKHRTTLPDPDVIAQEIVEDLEAALEQFREIVTDLDNGKSSNT